MRMRPECVPCLIKRVIFEAKLVDENKAAEAAALAARILGDGFTGREVSAELATVVHNRVYELLESEDPYGELKELSNRTAESLMPGARKYVESAEGADGRFRAAVLASIAGNVMDFGIRADMASPDVLETCFDELVREGLAVDHTPEIREYCAPGKSVLYFTDNCGEVVLDALLAREIKELGARLVVVVKGKPILTDATREDAQRAGLDEISDLVLDTGTGAVGVDLRGLPDDLAREMESCDLLLCKGMANFESFSDTRYRPMAYLMRTKCAPVAQAAGAPVDANIALLRGA